MGSFTPSWAQRRRNMGNIASNEASLIAKECGKYQWKTGVLRISDWVGHVLILKPYGPQLGPQTGPTWGQSLLTKAGPSSKRRIWPILGQSANHSPVHCLASCPERTCTPQLKPHQWTEDCSNQSAPLLNYHASAPLGRADFICPILIEWWTNYNINMYKPSIYICVYT